MSDKQPKAVKGTKSPEQRMRDPQAFERTYQAGPLSGELFLPYKAAPGEKISSVGDAYIVLGKDKPSGINSGYFGETNCSTIDLVAGRWGAVGQKIRESDPDRRANNSFKFDAARIYISQRTDIDDNLGLTNFYDIKGVIDGAAKNKSAIALKADGVRLVARESIKLVTMTDKYNSSNNAIAGKYGIDLIAGANINEPNYDLQPMVKGKNMILCLKQMSKHVAELDTQIGSLNKQVRQMVLAFITHSHVSGVPVTGPPIDPNSITQNILTSIDGLMQIVEINLRQFNHAAFEKNYLTPGSATYICSKQNKTT
tara:strand:+ start:4780 stop:5715 length:936 start_codon:yes stop_codon:yes gene_type:complete